MSDQISVRCPGCGKTIKAPAEYAGRSAKCPGCQASLTIPSPQVSSPQVPRVATKPAASGFSAVMLGGVAVMSLFAGLAAGYTASATAHGSKAAELQVLLSEAESAAMDERQNMQTTLAETKSRMEKLKALDDAWRATADQRINRYALFSYKGASRELAYLCSQEGRPAVRRLARLSPVESASVSLAAARIAIGAGRDIDVRTIKELVGSVRLLEEYERGSIPEADEEVLDVLDPDRSIRDWSKKLGLDEAE